MRLLIRILGAPDQCRRLGYLGDERRKFAEPEIALRDFGEPEDVGHAIACLVSPRAAHITGVVLTVDSGMRRYPF